VRTLQEIREGVCIDTVQKQPPTLTIQPRSVFTRRYPCPTRTHQPQISARRPSRSLGAFYLWRLHFQTPPSAKTMRKLVAANMRPPPSQQVQRAKTTQDGDGTRSQIPNPKGLLHVQFRPMRRVLRDGHQPSGPILLQRKRTRTSL
jgi:hypothetical protein